MRAFEAAQLLLPAGLIFLVIASASMLATRNYLLSIALGLLKAAVFVVYYAVIFDGTYTFLDDWTYLRQGELLITRDIGWLNLTENFDEASSIADGSHVLYYLYNASAIRLFGPYYFSPVALNVSLTAVVAWLGARLAVSEGLIVQESKVLFYCFLLLHPDITAWSTVMNGKDIVVLALHVVLLVSIADYYRGRWLSALLTGAAAVFPLTFLRFYVPAMMATAFAAVAVFQAQGLAKLRPLTVAFSLLAVTAYWFGGDTIDYARSEIQANLANPAFGFVRFLLTPIPFKADEAFSFLNWPMIFHWALVPCAVVGLVLVWRKETKFGRFFLSNFFIFVGLYSIYAGLQGPRHRVQLDYAIALCQFMGLSYMLRLRSPDESLPAPDSIPSPLNRADTSPDASGGQLANRPA